jgi:hypothetical protein
MTTMRSPRGSLFVVEDEVMIRADEVEKAIKSVAQAPEH